MSMTNLIKAMIGWVLMWGDMASFLLYNTLIPLILKGEYIMRFHIDSLCLILKASKRNNYTFH